MTATKKFIVVLNLKSLGNFYLCDLPNITVVTIITEVQSFKPVGNNDVGTNFVKKPYIPFFLARIKRGNIVPSFFKNFNRY